MSYLNSREEHGRTVKSVDVPRFTTHLATALGGKVIRDSERGVSSFELNGAEISVGTVWNAKDKATLHISPYPHRYVGGYGPYGDEYKLPSIRVSVDRPMAVLAKDVKRRLIDPAQAPLAKRREYVAQHDKSVNDLAMTAKQFREEFPGLTARHEQSDTTGKLYINQENRPYISGTFYDNGNVSLERLSLTRDQFTALMRALYGSGS